MKVLFTNTGPWGTGSATVVNGVMSELIRKGHQARVIFPDSGFKSPDFNRYYDYPDKFNILKFPATQNGEHLYTFPLIITDPHPRNFPHAWTFKDLNRQQLQAYMDYYGKFTEKVIEEFQPDVIECQHIWIMDYVLGKKGYPYISVAHHSDQLGFRYDRRMRKYARRAARHASYIFAISESVKEEVLELYPVDPERVVVLPNGYDQSVFYRNEVDRGELLARFGLEHLRNTPIITFAGKISKTKGIDFLLRANRIIQKHREAAIVVFGAGDLEDVLSGIPADAYDMGNVVMMGHQTPEVLAAFHNIARLSVLPSRSEGFGIAALEAMGCGIPMVATRTGGLAKLVVGGLVPIGDYRELARQVLRILSLPEKEHHKLCDQAHKRAHEYSWKKIVKQRLRIYQSLRESRSSL
ncbi:MAG: glycosyltransferase family 4 protein [Spirochaetaceae bacterium]|nr:MAG: glycosyltransferase family 4 protein [Spirochaetaceae bacterium]